MSRETIDFLARLGANNDRRWFELNRADYESHLKQPGEAFAQALADQLREVTGEPHDYRIFRVHRDIRFSKDKTPYNAHLHISLSAGGGCKDGGPVWMVGLDPEGLTLGAGIVAFAAPQRLRWQSIIASPEGAAVAALVDRLCARGVRITEPELRRVPAPHPADHPRAALLRHKGLTAWIDGLASEVALGSGGPSNCCSALLELRELIKILRKL